MIGLAAMASPPERAADAPPKPQTEKVAAYVNGRPIYEHQLQPELAASLKKFKRFNMRREDSNLVARLRRRALDKAIGDNLILQESEKLTIENLDERVAGKLEALKRKHGSPERLHAYLARRGLTLEGVRSSFGVQVRIDEYLKRNGITDPPIPEARIREAYEQHPEGYATEQAVEVSHILIAVDEPLGAEGDARALQEARSIRRDILAGADFADMAKARSDCNSAAAGGSLGYIKRGYMPEAFDRVAFALAKDAISEPVRTVFGYHIIKVTNLKPGGVAPYEKVRDFIEKYLQQQESEKRLEAHVAALKGKANIQIVE